MVRIGRVVGSDERDGGGDGGCVKGGADGDGCDISGPVGHLLH